MRCSGASVFRTPSHVKASLTAAMVVRSLLAALGVVWVMGVLLGWVVDRGDWFWLFVGSVVVAVDMWPLKEVGGMAEKACMQTRLVGSLRFRQLKFDEWFA